MHRRACPGLIALLLAPLACSSSGTQTEPAPSASAATVVEPTMTGDELCHALLVAPMERMLTSCGAADQGPELEAEKEAMATARAMCLEQVAAPLQDGRLSLDNTRAHACIEELARVGNGWVGVHARSINLAPIPACAGLFVPRQAAGDVCRSALECMNDLGCVGAEQGTVGKCSAANPDDLCSTSTAAFGMARRSECPPSKACIPGLEREAFLLGGFERVEALPHSATSQSPRHPRIRVRLGNATITGGPPVEVVQRVVRQSFGRFRRCYESGLARNATLKGNVTVGFTILKDGALSGATLKRATLPDETAKKCIVASFFDISFPALEGNNPAKVVYPIDFDTDVAPPPAAEPSASSKSATARAPLPARDASWIFPEGKATRATFGLRPAITGRCGDKDKKWACLFHVDCELGQYCSEAEIQSQPNQCQPKKAAGSTCSQPSECKGTCRNHACISFCGSG